MKAKLTILKRAMAVFALVATLASCGKKSESELESVATNDCRELITFAVACDDDATRGAIVTDLTEFYVYAVDSQDEVIINHAKFTLSGSTWVTDKDFYWSNYETTFYAYTPLVDTIDTTTLNYDMTDMAVTAQPDLMVATYTAKSGSVSLKFARILGLIKFSASGDGYDVDNVSISGLYDCGLYDMAADSPAWSSMSKSGTAYYADLNETADEKTGQITSSTGYIMVFPQTTDLTIVATNTEGTTKEYTLSGVEYKAGTLYNYTIKLDEIVPPPVPSFSVYYVNSDGSEVAEASIGSLAITKGATLKFTIGNTENVPDNAEIEWSSSDDDIATINSSGLATVVAAGVVTFTATYDEVSSDFTIKLISFTAELNSEYGSGII